MPELTLVIGNKNYSSWSLRPWLAMKQFGLKFNEIVIPLYGQDSGSAISQYSRSAKVPVLLDDHLKIWDSLAICEYLAEKFPERSYWGRTREIRANARSITAEMHSGFLPLRQALPMNCRRPSRSITITSTVDQDIQRISAIWREYRQQFAAKGEFLFGDFSLADAFYAPVVLRFRTYAIELDPICQGYAATILNLPAMQDWLTAASAETETIPEFDR
jgi:glutathione S-transferase